MARPLKLTIILGAAIGFSSSAVAAEVKYRAKPDNDRMITKVITGNTKAARETSKVRRQTSRDNRYVGDEGSK